MHLCQLKQVLTVYLGTILIFVCVCTHTPLCVCKAWKRLSHKQSQIPVCIDGECSALERLQVGATETAETEAALDGLITRRRSTRSALAKLWLEQTCPLVCVHRQISVLPYIRHLCRPIYFEEKAISLVYNRCVDKVCLRVVGRFWRRRNGLWVHKCVYVAGCYVVNRSARYSNPLDVCVRLPITKQEELTDLRKEGNCSYTATVWQTSNRTGQYVYSWKLINC